MGSGGRAGYFLLILTSPPPQTFKHQKKREFLNDRSYNFGGKLFPSCLNTFLITQTPNPSCSISFSPRVVLHFREKSSYGKNGFMMASQCGHFNISILLLELGLNIATEETKNKLRRNTQFKTLLIEAFFGPFLGPDSQKSLVGTTLKKLGNFKNFTKKNFRPWSIFWNFQLRCATKTR